MVIGSIFAVMAILVGLWTARRDSEYRRRPQTASLPSAVYGRARLHPSDRSEAYGRIADLAGVREVRGKIGADGWPDSSGEVTVVLEEWVQPVQYGALRLFVEDELPVGMHARFVRFGDVPKNSFVLARGWS